MNPKQTGKLGEDIACDYLKNKGYKILERNFEMKVSRFFKSEIDIIAKKDNVIHFIEVKTLKKMVGGCASNPDWFVCGSPPATDFFPPERRVNFKKKQKLMKAAQMWLTKNKLPLDIKWQIDIISVIINSETQKSQISHFENIITF